MKLRHLHLALWCTLALLGAQVLAPVLAQWHGVWHGTTQAGPALRAAAESAEFQAGGLHDHVPGSVECRLWDQLLLAGAPPVAAPVGGPVLAPIAPVAVATAGVLPAPVWGRSARAPPGPALLS